MMISQFTATENISPPLLRSVGFRTGILAPAIFIVAVCPMSSTSMVVHWLDDVRADDIASVGGKAAGLGELVDAGFHIPDGFVLPAETYREALEADGIADDLREAVAVDVEDSSALRSAAETAHTLITSMEFTEEVRESILEAYSQLGEESSSAVVAVRSSATAEDLPDASFAGQQETYLNISGEEELLDRIRDCWASLYTQRAIYYRQRQGFSGEDVDIAVLVQQMVDAEKAGVLFTVHPSSGADQIVIEASWGLGESIVSGTVTPDQYILDRDTGELLEQSIETKTQQVVRDPETGASVTEPVPSERQDVAVLSEEELADLHELAAGIHEHHGDAQDVEWAILDGEVYLLQSRPITTGPAEDPPEAPAEDLETDSDEPLVTGLGASPGIASGPARLVTRLDRLDQVQDGDVLVAEHTTPDMVPAMQRAAAIVTDSGGMTSHAAIVSRELGVPAVTGTNNATTTIEDGQRVRVDGDKGIVTAAPDESEKVTPSEDRSVAQQASSPPKPMTGTEVKVNVSLPSAAERAAATGADGVGLLRLEHLVLTLGKTPEQYIKDAGERAFRDRILNGIRTVADAFYPRPVRVRTLDAPTDEFRELEGGEGEPIENNPMLGYRGIRRSLDRPAVFRQELSAITRLQEMGYDNLEVMFPLVMDAREVAEARGHLESVGFDVERDPWGVMLETPASALIIEDIIDEGVHFVSFGTNDLTQYTLGVDRNNSAVADRFDEMHPAVQRFLRETIAVCRERGVDTSVCGEAASRRDMAEFLVEAGVTSLSPNIDAVKSVQETVKRVEQRLVLESIR